MKLKFLLSLSLTPLLINAFTTQAFSSTGEYNEMTAASATRSALVEAEILSIPGVFETIDITKSADLYFGLLSNDEFIDSIPARFFDFIQNESTGELARLQLGYHLAALVALGPKIYDTLQHSNYNWVLQTDKQRGQTRPADNLYAYFGNTQHDGMRQFMWNTMREVGFVLSDLEKVEDVSFYDQGSILANLVAANPGSDIVLGGNGIPTYYESVNKQATWGPLDTDALNTTSFPSSDYKCSYQNKITIGIDHRHRPTIIANVFDCALWNRVDPTQIHSIYYVHDFNANELRNALPEALQDKLVSLPR